ncbi:MAG TPA: ATP-binding cassette domain-containing protein [Propionibacteriaceae bacterium]|nr:ATP-binding cassette domain-containing protein [Propionibacteriaceae bacterium]
MAAIIEVRDFAMRFGDLTVIDGLSFDVVEGETFGLLGSNGSGKTTTIRALLGIYEPSAGELLVEGRRFHPSQSARLGYLPEERGLYQKESVIDVMAYFGRLKGLGKRDAVAWSLRYLEQVGLRSKARVRLDKLSGGEQQKVQLGVTIMNDPAILILDEPTKGFDPVTRRLLLDLLAEQKSRGSSIVFISHQMDEVERLCDRILLLKDGRAEAYGPIPEVQDKYGGRRIRLEFAGELPASDSFTAVVHDRNYAELAFGEGLDPNEVLRDLLAAGVQVRSYDVTRISMEEVFLRVYGAEAAKEA